MDGVRGRDSSSSIPPLPCDGRAGRRGEVCLLRNPLRSINHQALTRNLPNDDLISRHLGLDPLQHNRIPSDITKKQKLRRRIGGHRRAKLQQSRSSSATPCRDLDAGHDRVLSPLPAGHLDPQSLKCGMGAVILSISGDQGSMCLQALACFGGHLSKSANLFGSWP